MQITSFPPFVLSVAAADHISRFGTLRLTFDGRSVRVAPEAPAPGDAVCGCDGIRLAFPQHLTQQLTGGQLDFDGWFHFTPAVSAPVPLRPTVQVAPSPPLATAC